MIKDFLKTHRVSVHFDDKEILAFSTENLRPKNSQEMLNLFKAIVEMLESESEVIDLSEENL